MSNDFSASEWLSKRLPEYRKPPVVETALAVEFAPIAGWNAIRYGDVWQRFKNEYPKAEIQPAPQILFTQSLDLANPPIRCLLIDDKGNQLIQIRPGGFVRNWRANRDDHVYPRYETIRPSFEKDWGIFCEYLTLSGFAQPEVWQCEVTYVNHFLRGREWNEASDLRDALPFLSVPIYSETLKSLEQVRAVCTYALPADIGHLQFQLQPGMSSDGEEIMQLTITAVGKPTGSSTVEIMKWLDLGRHAVVQGFSDFTSPNTQTSIWERIWP